MDHLPSISNNVVLAELVTVNTLVMAIFSLPLSSCRREEAFFAFSSTPRARGFVWRVYTSQVTFDFPAATWNASLIDAFMWRLQ